MHALVQDIIQHPRVLTTLTFSFILAFQRKCCILKGLDAWQHRISLSNTFLAYI